MVDSSIGAENVRAARALLGISQQQLAASASVAVSTVADFERGVRTPVQNNLAAIRTALENAGIVFKDGNISYCVKWTVYTEGSQSTLAIYAHQPDHMTVLRDFLIIFGDWDGASLKFDIVQVASQSLKKKLNEYVDQFADGKSSSLRGLQNKISQLKDNEFFLIVPGEPTSTAENSQYEMLLTQLNHPEKRGLESEIKVLFGDLLDKYNIVYPRMDSPNKSGNELKKNRTCRFCKKNYTSGARFNNKAHAIPASLGNKFLLLADECDECNSYFGSNVEPYLVKFLDIQRVFLGIKTRGDKLPKLQFGNSTMFNDGEKVVITSNQMSRDAQNVFDIQLGESRQTIPQKIYQALAKAALSVMPDEELGALAETIKWVRYNEHSEKLLPKVAAAIVNLPPVPSAVVTVYIRKDSGPLPHVVCEFRLGCFIYVYVLPHSVRDDNSLIGFFDNHYFKETFKHYSAVTGWRFIDLNGTIPVTVNHKLKLVSHEVDYQSARHM